MASTTVARQASLQLEYNSVSVTETIMPDLERFTYTDPASGESDSVEIELGDPDGLWISTWFPKLGDKLKASIKVSDWYDFGDSIVHECGKFGVDSFSFNGGPVKLTIKALSMPSHNAFKATERTETYENVDLYEIAQTAAGRAGIQLVYTAPGVWIEKVEQNKQPDSTFLNDLVHRYGYAMKIYGDKLVIFNEADYEAKGPKLTLGPGDFAPEWSWDTQLQGTYTGVKLQYTSSDKNMTFTVEAGDVSGDRVLVCNEQVENLTEAQLVALAALNNANVEMTTMTIKLMGCPGLIATDTIQISGLGQIDGKYYVTECTSSLGSGYETTVTMRKVIERITSVTTATAEVVEED